MAKTNKRIGAWLQQNGVSFRVWAPFADAVSIIGHFNDWQEQPLVSEGDGYWYVHISHGQAGQEYKYVIRNGDKTVRRNDPRALHFTTSSGNSVIASSDFDWSGDDFVPPPVEQQVIYELHVGTFSRTDPAMSGTFRDVEDKLDHLASLGINMIELMPISSMLMDRGWGYAIDYIFAVESLYGGRHAFLQFVRAAHSRGIGVILDVVYNHFGPDASLDLWQFDGWSEDGKGGIYFYNDWRAETPWGNTRPDFGREEVRQYIVDNVRMWLLDCHVDGLRVDSTIFIRNAKGYNNDPSTDLPEGWKLLQQITTAAHKINPRALTIAEDVADNEYLVRPVNEGGAGFGAQWELNFPHALRQALSSNERSHINLTDICSELTRRYNNDAFQRVVFIDSHDSAANGSARFNEAIAPGDAEGMFAQRQSLLAAVLLMTAPGIPMLFQGQEFMEIGSFTDWKGLDWTRAERHKGVTEAFRHLIALRKNEQGISAGLTGRDINLMHVDEDNKVIAYHRWKQGGVKDDVVVIVNFGDIDHKQYVMSFPRNGVWLARFTSCWKGYGDHLSGSTIPDVVVDNGGGTVIVPAATAIILSQDT